MREGLIIPERIQLEIVFGCNASCSMCPVDLPTDRNKGVMSMDLFKDIVDEMNPYKNSIEKFDLWGLGEPLLDKGLFWMRIDKTIF
jgi:MoaA/NifB/PqqE/SkfB family radical SAM enzyme